MPECPNCNHPVSERAKFCEACGSALDGSASRAALNAAPIISVSVGSRGMSVMLLPADNMPYEAASRTISELCGYGEDEALLIAQSAPVTLAQRLTEEQAVRLALGLQKCGLELAIYDSDGYRVYDENALAAISARAREPIGGGSRIPRYLIRPWNYPYAFEGDKPPAFARVSLYP